MKTRLKPVNHGRDHSPGGADPIPNLSGGINFDTYPQAGEWLYVETDGAGTSPSGFGMEFFDDSGNGIDISADGAHLRLNEFGSGDAQVITTAGDGLLQGQSVEVKAATSGSQATFRSHGGTALVTSDVVAFETPLVQLKVGDLIVQLDDTGAFTIFDNGTAQKYLEVDITGGGGYHIITGGSWVADL
jgi:hypothetical protein